MLSIIFAIAIIAAIVIPLVALSIINHIYSRIKDETMGTIVMIEDPEDEDPYVFLKIDRQNFDVLSKKKAILLEVDYKKNRSNNKAFNGKDVVNNEEGGLL